SSAWRSGGSAPPPAGILDGSLTWAPPRGRWDALATVALLDLDDHLDLDRGVQRQHGHAHRAAGVPARLAEHLAEQLTGPVDDLRLAGEGGGAGHEPHDLDHAPD